MLPEILLIASLCSVDVATDCNIHVIDEWQAVSESFTVSPQSSSDMQIDCLSAVYDSYNVNVKSFACYKMIVDDAQGFTVQSLTDGTMITIFYDDFIGVYSGS